MTDDERFAQHLDLIFEGMKELLLRKRRAYGTTNLTRFGAIGIVIRASDKIDRLANLHKSGDPVSADGESAEDAWRDLIGYGALGLIHHITTEQER
jgi:hypothetical protein